LISFIEKQNNLRKSTLQFPKLQVLFFTGDDICLQ